MPRNPSTGIYATLVGTDGTTNYPIESTKYNLNVHDVETDLNTPRPVVAGGTGATSATNALINLSGEQAAQIVTNWDSTVWLPGSFYAATTATGTAPVAAHAFSGICYSSDPLPTGPTYTPIQQNTVLEARDLTDPAQLKYVRIRKAGVWGAWTTDRQSTYAAPLDAMAYSGMQINGSMDVTQERTAGVVLGINGYVCDGWYVLKVGTVVLNSQLGANTTVVPGLSYFLSMNVATAQTSFAANDEASLFHLIEGYRIARLAWGTANAQPITVSFWTFHIRTGTYSVVVRNGADNRSYATTYTQNVSGVPEFKTVTIPGDTAGTWTIDNTRGMQIIFAMAAGTNKTAGSANTWFAGNVTAAPGQINGVATTADSFRITGVVVLPGIDAPSAARAPLIMRPFRQELDICKPYWQPVLASLRFYATAANMTSSVQVPWMIQMRSTPTVALGTPSGANNLLGGVAANAGANAFGFRLEIISAAVGDTYVLVVPVTADARL